MPEGAPQDQPVLLSIGELSIETDPRSHWRRKETPIQAPLHRKGSLSPGMFPVDLGESFPGEEVRT